MPDLVASVLDRVILGAVALLLLVYAQSLRVDVAGARAELSQIRAEHALALADLREQAQEAEQEVAAREQSLRDTISHLEDEYYAQAQQTQRQLAAAGNALDRERAAVDKLRKQAAAGGSRAACDKAGAAAAIAAIGPSEQGSSALDLLAELLAERGSQLVEVSRHADELRAAGLACEQSYDHARDARVMD